MHKDLQLCAQVAQALELSLLESDDDTLADLHLLEVVPAPDATRLRVVVGLAGSSADDLSRQARFAAARDALARHERRLRAAVAGAIRRKRAPELCFFVAPAPGVQR